MYRGNISYKIVNLQYCPQIDKPLLITITTVLYQYVRVEKPRYGSFKSKK